MGRMGVRIARLFGKKLPAFDSKIKAETTLRDFRDDRLQKIMDAAETSGKFAADFTPESLKSLEGWYFDLFENNNFRNLKINREEFEECMAMYFGEVLVRNVSKADWIVEEFSFTPGRFEIGVRIGLLTVMLGRFHDYFETPNNKRKQSLYRKYKSYASS